jgi:asparagine synthase (glutamine-hydrolysing)
MCGLAGFLTLEHFSENPETILAAMADAISHRGPNDSGIWYSEAESIYFAHQRLSIQDVTSAGHQPMISKSSRYVIVFNGEIYNHLELRDSLSVTSWTGHSDTETLLVCFEEWGIEKTLTEISGMFAIALWDRATKKLLLARDRFGEKPIYYGKTSSSFFFGSELKALRKFPFWRAEENIDALSFLLRYAYIPSPLTIYKNVFKLPAGSYIEVSLKDFPKKEPTIWWNFAKISSDLSQYEYISSDNEAIADFGNVLTQSVKRQMISDVPIGALLSGGIDSSLITSIMQSVSKTPIRTYTIGFSEAKYDESAHARAIADHLGTCHSEINVKAQDAINIIPKLSDIYDEPFADSSQIPSFLVSQFTSDYVKVCLSGDGADEIFGGYNRYLIAPKIWSIVSIFPLSMRKQIRRALIKIPAEKFEIISKVLSRMRSNKLYVHNFGEKFIKVADSLNASNFDEFYSSFLSQWQGHLPLFNYSAPKALLNDFDNWPFPGNYVQRMMTVDAMTYLTDDILVKMDRASMSVGLEVRAPFLNEKVVEFALTRGQDKKIRSGQGKWILRQLLRKYIPSELLDRPKQGFSVPIEYWLRGPLKDWVEDLLSEKKLTAKGILDPKPIRAMWLSHLNGNNYQYPLWNVLMYQSWSDKWH